MKFVDRVTGSQQLTWKPLKLRCDSFPLFDVPVTVLHEIDEHSPFHRMVADRQRSKVVEAASAAAGGSPAAAERDRKGGLKQEDGADPSSGSGATTLDLEQLSGGGDPSAGLVRYVRIPTSCQSEWVRTISKL